MTETHSGARSIRWRWIAAMWCAGGLFEASQAVLIMRFGEAGHAWLPLFATELATWLPWALATPWIISLARRYPIIRGTTVRTVAVHLAAFVTISVVAQAWSARSRCSSIPGAIAAADLLGHLEHHTPLSGPDLPDRVRAILTITYLVDSRENIARQMTETARLNEELSKAQLAALRRQMEPHFMFNTLNSIAGLVRDHRNDAAVSMIVGLSEFLRRASRGLAPLAGDPGRGSRIFAALCRHPEGSFRRTSAGQRGHPGRPAGRAGSQPAAAASGRKRHQAWRCQARSGREPSASLARAGTAAST